MKCRGVAVVALLMSGGAACKFPYPADVPADGAADDASGIDGPALPIVVDNQAADLVLGAADFTSIGHGGFTPISIKPRGLASDGVTLWATDVPRQRILIWDPLPTTNDAPATRVLGRPSLTDSTAPGTVSLSSMAEGWPYVSGSLLLVSDGGNRLMGWNPRPTTNGEAADFLIGQTTISGSSPGSGVGQLRGPRGLWTDGTHLVVADQYNHRVLFWNTLPASPLTPATFVLGQNGYVTPVSYPTSAASMSFPARAFFDGTRLYVADQANNRVMIWFGFPTADNQQASFILGQPNATSNAPGSGPAGMKEPQDVAVLGDTLFVADSGNNRILVFKPIPNATGAAASYVLGQPDLNSVVGNNPAPTARNMSTPTGLAVAGNKLYVSDFDRERILRFHLNVP